MNANHFLCIHRDQLRVLISQHVYRTRLQHNACIANTSSGISLHPAEVQYNSVCHVTDVCSLKKCAHAGGYSWQTPCPLFLSHTTHAGLEPHSALPTAMSAVFGIQSQMLPKALRGRTHGLASSVVSNVHCAGRMTAATAVLTTC